MWYKAISDISSVVGTNFILGCDAHISLAGWEDMHPAQAALHNGAVGKGHSWRDRKKFCALGHP
jgi:hypothetical protein